MRPTHEQIISSVSNLRTVRIQGRRWGWEAYHAKTPTVCPYYQADCNSANLRIGWYEGWTAAKDGKDKP